MSRHFWIIVTILAIVAAGTMWRQGQGQAQATVALAAERAERLPAPRLTIPTGARVAVFAGGCFWGIEEAFRTTPGVLSTEAGYMGGMASHPTYETIHRSETGYVEAVEVVYDPHKVSYPALLRVFFDSHTPTRSTRAIGSAYRSFVFTADAAQHRDAALFVAALAQSKTYRGAPRPFATQIRPATVFWPAERYHQQYYAKRGAARATCAL